MQPMWQPASMLPGVGSTVAITLLFGLFGLIPAIQNTSHARMVGRPTNRYWSAFWWSIAGSTLGWILFWVIVAAAIKSSTPTY